MRVVPLLYYFTSFMSSVDVKKLMRFLINDKNKMNRYGIYVVIRIKRATDSSIGFVNEFADDCSYYEMILFLR